MSKSVKDFFVKIKKNFDLAKKFKASFTPGSRILPSKTSKNDTEYQFRIDAGELINNQFLNLVLQVNSQAKATGLREWLRKQPQGTHAKLATVRFDTLAEDPEEETMRALGELESQAKENL